MSGQFNVMRRRSLVTVVMLLGILVSLPFAPIWGLESATMVPAVGAEGVRVYEAQETPVVGSELLAELYEKLHPGVVNIQVFVKRGLLTGQGAGSGFLLDEDGHIVTNNHVVSGAERVTIIFFDGTEAKAKVIGQDADSDLAVIKVDDLPEEAHPLVLGESRQVKVGEWAIAIGNPFGLGGSMTLGIVSAVGRTIASGATPFSIPQAIQTDAAINPGNSGGPLFNLKGEVIGVNAQIATAGTRANAGVGFAIPSDIVKLVTPELIENGFYQWPWLGIEGASVNLMIMEANELETQKGAYIASVVANSPAARAELRGSSDTVEIDGVQVPVGGDVVIAIDGKPIVDFSDLLVEVAYRRPGDTMRLTVVREGEMREITVKLAPRPVFREG